MKREIKFRAWDKENKIWLEEFLVTPDGELLIIGEYEKAKVGLTNGWISGENIELVRFTGLLDKNGKEIYEGDILVVIQKNKEEKAFSKIIMKFENHHIGDFHNWEIHGFRDYSKSTYGFEVEIIGNIYENKELMK